MTKNFENLRRAAFRVALYVFFGSCIGVVVAGCEKAKEIDDRLVIETAAGPQIFKIEVARTAEEKSRGLMFRTSLEPGHGMLFPYDEPLEASMWMRNTYISLDMIFISSEGRIERIAERTEPLSDDIVSSGSMVTAVLEIGGGEAARLEIRPGDIVRHPHFAVP